MESTRQRQRCAGWLIDSEPNRKRLRCRYSPRKALNGAASQAEPGSVFNRRVDACRSSMSAVLGFPSARSFSEPMNRALRGGPRQVGLFPSGS